MSDTTTPIPSNGNNGGGPVTLDAFQKATAYPILTDEITAYDRSDTATSGRGGTSNIGRLVDGAIRDVLAWRPDQTYDVWHDRAVFHFLTAAEDRAAYRRVLESALRPGGRVVMSTFAEDGPEQCSGLPVTRWSAEDLAAELGEGYALEHSERVEHTTPWETVQPFTAVVLRRVS